MMPTDAWAMVGCFLLNLLVVGHTILTQGALPSSHDAAPKAQYVPYSFEVDVLLLFLRFWSHIPADQRNDMGVFIVVVLAQNVAEPQCISKCCNGCVCIINLNTTVQLRKRFFLRMSHKFRVGLTTLPGLSRCYEPLYLTLQDWITQLLQLQSAWRIDIYIAFSSV